MTLTRTQLQGVLVDERGHQHVHRAALQDVPSRVNDVIVTRVDEREGQHVMVLDRSVFPCRICDTYPEFVYAPAGASQEPVLRARTACPHPDGVPIELVLDVPSGRVVVADSLRPVFDVDVPASPSYNSMVGQALYCQEMAQIGCAYGPVLNTCPSLLRTGPDRYVIASYDEGAEPGEHLASISTDLWAYSIADHDRYQERAAQLGQHVNEDRFTVVAVRPGRYRFRHHTSRNGFDHDGPGTVVFADIERVGPVQVHPGDGHRARGQGRRAPR